MSVALRGCGPAIRVTFVSVSMEEARAAFRQKEEELADLEDAGAPPDDEPAWAGAHE